MSNFNDARRHTSNHVFIHKTHDEFPHVETPYGFVVPEYQNININDVVQESSIPPTTSLSSRAFSGSTFVDFEIPRNLHILKSATLLMNIVNNDGTDNLRMPVAFNLINRIEYYFGSTLVETTLGESLYFQYCTAHNYERRITLKKVNNVDPLTFDSDHTVVVNKNGGSRECHVRLYSLLSQMHLFLPGITQEIRVRIHFNSYDKWGIKSSMVQPVYTAPATEPVLQKVDLRLQHITLPSYNFKRLTNLYRNNTIGLKFMDHRFQSVSLPLSQGVSVNHVLSSINGLLSHMYIFVRKQNAKGKELQDFLPLQSFYIADASGSNIHNGIEYTDTYARTTYANDGYQTAFFSEKNVYPINFTQDVKATVVTGNNMGNRYFSGQEQIYLKPDVSRPDATNGITDSAELMIMYLAHAQLVIKNGLVEVLKS